MPVALYALALGGFGIGLTEFGILGLLPEVAADFGVSDAVAGSLVSGYALAVAVGAIIFTAILGRIERKHALLGLLVLFIIGNLVSAVAVDYNVMMVGLIIAALCHGAFFGIGTVVAASLVSADRRGAALATMFGGLTLANVLGVPLGTLLGQAAGWRSTFWVITVIGVFAFLGILFLVRRQGANAPGSSVRGEFRIFRSGQVWLSMAVTILGYGGMFGAFSYIAFTLTEVSGFASSAVPWLLMLFGVGLFFGNILGGKFADRNLPLTLIVVLAALVVILVVFALTAQNQIATIILLALTGGFGFATVPALQMRIMNHTQSAPTLGAGANVAAFNVGNALGVWVAGLTLIAGGGYTAPLWAGAAVTLLGLGVFTLAAASRGGEWRQSAIVPALITTPLEKELR